MDELTEKKMFSFFSIIKSHQTTTNLQIVSGTHKHLSPSFAEIILALTLSFLRTLTNFPFQQIDNLYMYLYVCIVCVHVR